MAEEKDLSYGVVKGAFEGGILRIRAWVERKVGCDAGVSVSHE